MTPIIQIDGIDAITRTISKINKQVAFAASRAINKTAIQVQNHEIKSELPRALKIRSQWFKPGTRFGVNIRFANKTTLTATVGSQADWLRLVDKGGTKTPPKKALSIPVVGNIDTSGPRRKADKPARILQRGGFIAKMKSGKAGIFVRVGKARTPIKLLYSFSPTAKVPHILDFFESARSVVDATYLRNFSDEFQRAIATAR